MVKKYTFTIVAILTFSSISYGKAIIDKDILLRVQSPTAAVSRLSNQLTLIVFLYQMQDKASLIQKLQGMPDVTWQDLESIPAMTLQVPNNAAVIQDIANFNEVAQLSSHHGANKELDISTQSIKLAPSSYYPNLSNWWDAGFTGKSGVLGLIDTGVDPLHPGLSNKTLIIRKEAGSQYENYLNGVKEAHGTGVSCIYGSEDGKHKGIAYGLSTIVAGFSGEETADTASIMLTMSTLDWMLNRAEAKPTIINYSMGNGKLACPQCPEWSGLAKVIDYVVNKDKILWVKSAGNAGYIAPNNQYPFASTLTVPGDNYNGLTVANMDNNSMVDGHIVKTPNRNAHIIRYTSSRGPTPFGRKKPDITAPGHDTRTCAPSPEIYPLKYTEAMDYQNGFRLMGGTSSAAPHVGASALLLQDAGITSPMAIKALLINSAETWTDNNTEKTGHSKMAGSHWDRTYGWGYLDMAQAFKERHDIHEGVLTLEKPVWEYHATLAKGQKVTLVHERRVGYSKEGNEWRLSHLSLEIIDLSNHQTISQDDSAIDTVHQAANCKQAPGEKDCNETTQTMDALIRVRLLSSAIDGSPNEPFAIVIPEANIRGE